MAAQVSFNRLELDDDLRLRDLIVESSHNIEPGFRVIGGKLPIGDSRRLDLVGLDSQSRLALVEVRCREGSEWLLEAIDHYDWMRSHAEEMVRLYPQHSIDASRLPRLILVCSAFSEGFRRRLAHLESLPLELLEYRYLEVNGVRGLYFEPVPVPIGPHAPAPASLQDHLDRMADAERAAVAERLVARVVALDPGARLIVHRGGALVLWYDRLLARLEFSRRGAWVSDEVTDTWTEVRRFQELEQVLLALEARVAHWKRTQRPGPSRHAPRSGASPNSGRANSKTLDAATPQGSASSSRPRTPAGAGRSARPAAGAAPPPSGSSSRPAPDPPVVNVRHPSPSGSAPKAAPSPTDDGPVRERVEVDAPAAEAPARMDKDPRRG
ncbi:MAG: hypothetical protein V3U98_04905 [Acidobacteriota bacterium]